MGARRLYGFVAAFGVNLFHDPVQMIFDRELGKVEFTCDFLVGKASGDQRDQLLLAQGQARTRIDIARRFASFFGDPFK
jgi:hypothetical protein